MRELWSTLFGRRAPVTLRPGYRTILDLGTEQIKALVLELNEDEALVVGVGRARQQQGWELDGGVVDVRTMAQGCDQALRQAEDMTAETCGRQIVPDCAVVGLPNYLTVAETFAVTHHRSNPAKPINDKELRGVVERAQRSALQQLGRKAEAFRSCQEAKVQLLESSITDMQVDGHSVTDALGFRGENLTVAVFNVLVSSSHLRAIGAITDALGLEVLTTLSGWQPLGAALGEREGICVDVGGKATDIVLVRSGKAWATASLPLGGSDFTQHLIDTFGLSWKDAESLKLAYTRGMLKEASKAQVGEAVGRVMKAWLGGLEATLGRLSGSYPLPHQFNLCGGGSSLPGLVERMRSHPWMRTIGFRRHPQVRLMQAGEVSRVLDRTGQLGEQQDITPLALAGYTMAGDAKADSLEGLLWRVKRPAIFESRGGKA